MYLTLDSLFNDKEIDKTKFVYKYTQCERILLPFNGLLIL